jgi:hypothetical protein
MILNFPIELLAQHNHVLALTGQELLIRITGIPDARFRHKVETGAVDDRGTLAR